MLVPSEPVGYVWIYGGMLVVAAAAFLPRSWFSDRPVRTAQHGRPTRHDGPENPSRPASIRRADPRTPLVVARTAARLSSRRQWMGQPTDRDADLDSPQDAVPEPAETVEPSAPETAPGPDAQATDASGDVPRPRRRTDRWTPSRTPPPRSRPWTPVRRAWNRWSPALRPRILARPRRTTCRPPRNRRAPRPTQRPRVRPAPPRPRVTHPPSTIPPSTPPRRAPRPRPSPRPTRTRVPEPTRRHPPLRPTRPPTLTR